MGQVQVPEGSAAERFGDLIPEGLYSWCYVVLVLLIVAVRYILQRAGVLKDHMLLSTQLFVAVVIYLVLKASITWVLADRCKCFVWAADMP